MRIIITGGGTGGHVSPAVAVIEELRAQSATEGWPLELLYIGSKAGAEREIITAMGIKYVSVPVGKLRRYLSWKTPADLARIPGGVFAALRQVVRFHPDVIFSTGGFVSVPTVIAAWLRRVPVLIHEQTALVGLANRIAARFASVVAISYESSRKYFVRARRVALTGNPVRQIVFAGDAAQGYARFGLDRSVPLIYVTGGAQGSHLLNEAVGAGLPQLLASAAIIHQCGNGPDGSGADLHNLIARREQLPATQQARYAVLPFVRDEIADIYAATRLVIGRSGAGTVNELAALGKPAILVPLASSAAGEQMRNAETMSAAGGAVILPEAELSAERLSAEVSALLAHPAQLNTMGEAARKLAHPHAAEEIVAIIREIARLSSESKI
jgi:UDP-N-acetylglucosamine--N-acetylmuramyl-(pentapeptide) pyrophosphoryl-undecaprenol N-acetylglucosamine transferase